MQLKTSIATYLRRMATGNLDLITRVTILSNSCDAIFRGNRRQNIPQLFHITFDLGGTVQDKYQTITPYNTSHMRQCIPQNHGPRATCHIAFRI